jgi:hypothetical protein
MDVAEKITQSSCDCGNCGMTGSSNLTCTDKTNTVALQPAWIIGSISTAIGEVPQVAIQLTWADILGSWKCRWSNFRRMAYKVSPGLYAVGCPNNNSAVFVSANYKMSFDHLRRALKGMDAWILVLDTKGINVWCAAGKGTFGTEEIVTRIAKVRLTEVVSHRALIVPQLGAPGVAVHEVLKLSGFKVVYGPVRAKDLPEFMKAGQKATPKMREVKFGLWDRLILTPMELMQVWKYVMIGFAVIFIINLCGVGWVELFKAFYRTLADLVPYFGAVVAGTVLTPVLLPLIPVREFAWKGWIMGLLWAGFFIWHSWPLIGWKQVITYLLLLPPISAYLAMNFTGASTYTSLSGVVKEMGVAIPVMLISVGLGVIFLTVKVLAGF